MGVDLGAIVTKRTLTFEELAGKTLAVDAFNTIYQFITIIRQPDGTPLMDSRGRVTSHLSGLFYRTCNLLEKRVQPVFVFDGKSSVLKQRTIDERKAIKQEAEIERKKALEEGDVARAGQLAQRTARLTSEMVVEAKQLLDFMGIPWVQAPSEGEAQCAHMAKEGLVYAAASQDYDTLLFGAPLFVKNLSIAGKRKMPRFNKTVEVFPEEMNLAENLKALGITREKLIWIGLLAGTDFNEGIYGIGAKKGLKLVQTHDSFDAILKEIGKEMDWREVYELFENPPSVKVSEKDVQRHELQRDKLVGLMHDEHEFSLDRVEASIKKAYGEPEDSSQNQLKKWF